MESDAAASPRDGLSHGGTPHQVSLFRGDETQPISPLVEAQIQRWLLGCRADILDALAVCESEIERVLAMALLCASDAQGPFLRLTDRCADGGGKPWAKGRAGTLCAQYPHKLDGKNIRIDFVLMTGAKRLAIEADAFEGHHGSPEQVAKDDRRDRALQAEGWIVHRYVGRVIKRAPTATAAEILAVAGCKPGKAPPLPVVRQAAKLRGLVAPAVSVADGAKSVLDAIEQANHEIPPTRRRF